MTDFEAKINKLAIEHTPMLTGQLEIEPRETSVLINGAEISFMPLETFRIRTVEILQHIQTIQLRIKRVEEQQKEIAVAIAKTKQLALEALD